MLEFLWESFLPPYDILDVVIIIPLVLVIICTILYVYHSISDLVVHIQISRFFKAHNAETGKVIKYKITRGSSYSSVQPIIAGDITIMMPQYHETADKYFIVLKCSSGDECFQATYKIPADDYKRYKVGETIQIEDSWKPFGYECL